MFVPSETLDSLGAQDMRHETLNRLMHDISAGN